MNFDIAKALGIYNQSDAGIMPGNVFFAFDTPAPERGTYWYVDRFSLLVGNQGNSCDVGISGVFLCPPTTPLSSNLASSISAVQANTWLPIIVSESVSQDTGSSKTSYFIGGLTEPIIIPELWFLRVALQMTGASAWPANSFAQLNLLYARLQSGCNG